MIDRLVALVVDESKWLTLSMSAAAIGVLWLLIAHRDSPLPLRRRMLACLNLSAGIIVGSMAAGHLLAVATKLAFGTLREGSLAIFVAIGVVLLVPAWLVTRHTAVVLRDHEPSQASTLGLNAWLAVTLLAFGLHNLPLAAPALFTMAYRVYSRGLVGWAIVGAAAVFNTALFGASLVFLASGQSFEQFSGLE
jgi:hypothetical protein